MAQDATETINYYLCIDEAYKDNLAAIRLWPGLKAGAEDHCIWIKDFTYAQVHSPEVQQLPFKRIYTEKQGKLYPVQSLLPERSVPSLLWTPLERVLTVTLPSFNHNFFGIDQTIRVQLVPSENEKPAQALCVSVSDLDSYLQTCAAIRLQALQWCVLNTQQALILGVPLLPIPGQAFWQRDSFLLPTGYDFELHLLSDALQRVLNSDKAHWILWHADQTYSLIPKTDCMPLSLSSFRRTQQALTV